MKKLSLILLTTIFCASNANAFTLKASEPETRSTTKEMCVPVRLANGHYKKKCAEYDCSGNFCVAINLTGWCEYQSGIFVEGDGC